MEASAPAFSSYPAPAPTWRRAALVSAAVAAVELIVLVVIALAFLAKPFASDAKPAKAETKHVESAPAQVSVAAKPEKAAPSQAGSKAVAPHVPRASTSVLVLNGNGVSGAASGAASRLRALRYRVAAVTDASRRDFPRTIVMYRPGFEAEAQRLATDLRLDRRRAVPLDGLRVADLHGAQVALIIGG